MSHLRGFTYRKACEPFSVIFPVGNGGFTLYFWLRSFSTATVIAPSDYTSLLKPAKSITTTLLVSKFRSFQTISTESDAVPMSKDLFISVVP